MLTARRWLKCILAVTFFIGLSTSTLAADEDGNPGASNVEIYFWLCLTDHTPRESDHAYQCCDGAACYTCMKDYSMCSVEADPQGSSQSQTGSQSVWQNIRPMQERPTKRQLQNVCTGVKADFNELEGFGYSCANMNCDGKGNNCAIICDDDRKCTAQTPDVITGAVSLRGILQNGDNINHETGGTSGGSSGSSGDDDWPDGPIQ